MNNQRILPASGGDSYRSGVKRVLQGLLILATGGGIAMGAAALAQSSGPSVEKALAERLPKTEITAIDCEKIKGVCEVQARQNLFYIDHGARYLIIGRVYDMETKQDLTAARLLEMNPDMLIGGGGTRHRPIPPKRRGSKAQTPPRSTIRSIREHSLHCRKTVRSSWAAARGLSPSSAISAAATASVSTKPSRR
ncbi:disulfide isomerase DsbC N-terminal domain-containing protein [Qipengyuania profunda]|uniref:disulfide isomerase DsbC N-terminal domain-containing protein n=1 Tax=Qipengyuania profunda TaxID=3113984 RepID=UPI002A18E3B2|nr:disulfide isomerase DsbC N-terminal domain-containing protein [Qipengyuania sp. HL-TH1]WPL55489.1 disulfide isomerase DsbC N-terminal domain-containing protein [Qipengyuania sp. HL-TH5]